jgi:Skp family chaperone for outer membrane proteins
MRAPLAKAGTGTGDDSRRMLMTMRGLWMAAMLAVVAMAAQAGEPAAAPAAGGPTKVGVVRIQQIFKDFQYAKDQESLIKAEFKKSEDAITALKDQIDEKRKHVQNDPLIGPGTKKYKLEVLKIEEMKVELEDKLEEFRKERFKRMAEFYRSIYERFQKAIADYATRRGFDLVVTAPDTDLSKEAEESDSPVAIQNEILLRHVQFIGPACDITRDIVDLMNAMYQRNKARTAPGNL